MKLLTPAPPNGTYSLVKNIGLQDVKSELIRVECYNDIFDEDAEDCVAEHFASISQEYEPLNRNILPSFLLIYHINLEPNSQLSLLYP